MKQDNNVKGYNESRFVSTGNKGFQLSFPNGWTVSVQFGPENYTNVRSSCCPARYGSTVGRFEDMDAPMKQDNTSWSAETAEIAAWRTEEKNNISSGTTNSWYDFGNGDNVEGWKSTTEVLEFINMIAGQSPKEGRKNDESNV